MGASYLSYTMANVLARVLPRRFAYWVGLRAADSYYRRDVRGRAAVIANLRHILQYRGVEPSVDKLEIMARQTFQYFGKYLVDFFRYARLSTRQVDRFVSIEHPEYLVQALEHGKGALMTTAHLGNWEVGGAVLAAQGYVANAVFQPESDQKINSLFRARREGRGMKTIPLGQAARGIFRALGRNELVLLLADRDYGPRHDPVPFFGVPARLPRGPSVLCVRTGSPVVPGFLVRQPDDTFLLRYHPPIMAGPTADVHEVQARICGVLEQEISENPCQWFMFSEFWRSV